MHDEAKMIRVRPDWLRVPPRLHAGAMPRYPVAEGLQEDGERAVEMKTVAALPVPDYAFGRLERINARRVAEMDLHSLVRNPFDMSPMQLGQSVSTGWPSIRHCNPIKVRADVKFRHGAHRSAAYRHVRSADGRTGEPTTRP